MNLLCPSCQKMLQVPEQYAGQQMRCPLCSNIFTVPAAPEGSAAPPPPPPPPPPPQPAYNPPLPPSAPPPPPGAEMTFSVPVDTRPPGPPVLERDYERIKSYFISKRLVPWIAPIALFVIFLFTLLPFVSGPRGSVNAWGAGGAFIVHNICIILGMLAALFSLLVHLGAIPLPMNAPFRRFRSVITLSLVGLAFLMFFIGFLSAIVEIGFFPLGFLGLLMWWIELIALIFVLLEFWLQLRGPEAPSPRIDLHL